MEAADSKVYIVLPVYVFTAWRRKKKKQKKTTFHGRTTLFQGTKQKHKKNHKGVNIS